MSWNGSIDCCNTIFSVCYFSYRPTLQSKVHTVRKFQTYMSPQELHPFKSFGSSLTSLFKLAEG